MTTKFRFNLENHEYQKIHFVGIGGVSMSGIAGLLHDKGYTVTGSDRTEGDYIPHLKNLGIEVTVGQSKDNIKDQDLFIYTDAIKLDNEELKAAIATGKPCVSRGVFLGALMRNYDNSIAISGMHGKSSTTAMVAKILLGSSVDSTILIGGILDEIDGNFKIGNDEYFVTEACEYKGNILHYYPSTAVILNIDVEHVDYYRDIEQIVETFSRYVDNIGPLGITILNIDDKNVRKLLSSGKSRKITYGINNDQADYNVTNIKYDNLGYSTFDLKMPEQTVTFNLNVIGEFNIYNAAAAIIATYENGIDIETIKKGIADYKTLHRRMEVVGQYNGAKVIDDYGHHPKEIKSTLGALKPHTQNKLICVFQPHTYSRTLNLLDDYSEAFYDADDVVVTKVFPARETIATVHGTDVVKKLVDKGVNAKYLETFDEASDYIINNSQKGDTVLVTGCGDNNGITTMMFQKVINELNGKNEKLNHREEDNISESEKIDL